MSKHKTSNAQERKELKWSVDSINGGTITWNIFADPSVARQGVIRYDAMDGSTPYSNEPHIKFYGHLTGITEPTLNKLRRETKEFINQAKGARNVLQQN